MSSNYYNEIDPDAADRIEDLIVAGHIAPGVIDRRSIEDVHPSDLDGFAQCHFFAGFGVWSLALRRAGWPDDRPVWTGSCPCQPFSSAGQGAGFDDERHIWPHFQWLIQERRPPVIYGEQVASKDAEPWLDLVRDDLEGMGYAFGAVAFPSAGIGAPHIRDRTYWMADADCSAGREGRSHVRGRPAGGNAQPWAGSGSSRLLDGMADAPGERLEGRERGRQRDDAQLAAAKRAGAAGRLAYAAGERFDQDGGCVAQKECDGTAGDGAPDVPGQTNGQWRDADWLFCRDGKWRPVEPGTFPLAYGLPRGMGSMQPELRRLAGLAGLDQQSLARAKAFRFDGLRGYGNAINAEAACVFIESTMRAAA